MSAFEFEHCSHGVIKTQRCPKCWEAGMAAVTVEGRHSCHITYCIPGQVCSKPALRSDHGCAGCHHYGRPAK